MAGGVAVKPNVHIENWAHMREHLELGFRFTPKNVMRIGIWAVAVPVITYSIISQEFVSIGPALMIIFGVRCHVFPP
jgi:hypothetical protein